MSWGPRLGSDDNWRNDAACRESDARLFFPFGTTGAAIEQIDAAKAICRSCPVSQACLEFALDTSQEDGVWGGKDETERRRLRWQRRQPGRTLTLAPRPSGRLRTRGRDRW